MYGETANKLVQNAKRIQSLPHLPPYASDLSRTIVREVRDLDRDVSSILAPYGSSFNPSADPSTACALLVNHLCMRRNKRCLLAYHKVRAEKLEGYCWEGVDVLEQSGNGKEGDGGMAGKKDESSLSPEEEEYVRQYSDLLAAYKGQWTDIDLTGSLEPPRDLFIDVRVLKDAGEIQTEYGYAFRSHRTPRIASTLTMLRSITLTKNSQFYVRHGDVERLIAQGYLQRLS
jgi:GINS complex subunit 1